MARGSSEIAAERTPVMKVTRYEVYSSVLIAITMAIGLVLIAIVAMWLSTRIPKSTTIAVPVELVESPGGFEDGVAGETLRIDSPLPERADATLAEVESDKVEVAASLDAVVETAAEAVSLEATGSESFSDTGGAAIGGGAPAAAAVTFGTRNAGKPGSAKGTGGRPLGFGSGTGGFPREMRWHIRYADLSTTAEYARQLDFFKIELGAIVGTELIYISNLSSPTPNVRRVPSGADEKRLYMTWKGGDRRKADLELFQKANINVGGGMLFQFYPKDIEEQLAQIEFAYRKRKASEIRRTYFVVEKAGNGYQFSVTQQTYLK
jgi:hypothetical protein